MQIPVYLREQSELIAQKFKPAELKKAAAALSRTYLNNKGDGSRLVTGDLEAAVYSLVRMPATYCAVYTALKSAAEGAQIKNMLDLGAGTGAAFFAAHELFGLTEATLVEREKSMLSVARDLARAANLDVGTVRSDAQSFDGTQKYDLATASYVLNEADQATRERILDNMLRATRKLLVIVEPGTPQAFSLQKEIRRYLVAKGARLIAPCPAGAVCALPDGDWCHYSCRVERSRMHKFLKDGDAPYEDEKFTFSAFCVDGSLNACSARVLRHPVTEKGKVTLSLCSSNGIETLKLYKKDDGYKEARKLNAGDTFNISPDLFD